MAEVFANNAEGGTNGATVTVANSGGASGTAFSSLSIGTGATFAYDNTHARGTLAYKVATGTTNAVAYVQRNVTATATMGGRGYVYLTTAPPALHTVFRMMSGATVVADIRITTAGNFELNNTVGGTTVTSTQTIPLNAWVRFTWLLNISAGSFVAHFYDTADAALIDTLPLTGQSFGAIVTVDRMRTGVVLARADQPAFWLDDLAIDDAAEPGGTGPATLTTTGALPVVAGLGGTPAGIQVATAMGQLPAQAGFTAVGAPVNATAGTLPVTAGLKHEITSGLGHDPLGEGLLGGSNPPVAGTTGTLPCTATLGSAAVAVTATTGGLPVDAALTATGVPVKTEAGTLPVTARLVGDPTGATRTVNGSLQAAVGLSGVPGRVAETKTTTGSLPAATGLAGAVVPATATTGTFNITVNLGGVPVPVRSTSGQLTAQAGLSTAVASTHTTTGTLPTVVHLHASVTGTLQILTTTGTLPVAVALTATSTSIRTTTGALPVTVAVDSAATASLTTTGSLPAAVRVAAAMSATGPPPARRTVTTRPEPRVLATT